MTHAAKQLRTLDPQTQFADPTKYGIEGHSMDFVPFLETEEGVAYIEAIKAILAKAKKPLCVREIHKKLGKAARPKDTLDALRSLDAEERQAGDMRRFSSAVKRREIKDEPFNRKFITPKKGKQPKRVEPGYLFPNRQQLPPRIFEEMPTKNNSK